MIEKGLGGDWETLRHYLPSEASGGGLGTWQQGGKRPASQPAARPGAGPALLAVRQGPGSDLELIWVWLRPEMGSRCPPSHHLGGWERPVISFSSSSVPIQCFWPGQCWALWLDNQRLSSGSVRELLDGAPASDGLCGIGTQPIINRHLA